MTRENLEERAGLAGWFDMWGEGKAPPRLVSRRATGQRGAPFMRAWKPREGVRLGRTPAWEESLHLRGRRPGGEAGVQAGWGRDDGPQGRADPAPEGSVGGTGVLLARALPRC